MPTRVITKALATEEDISLGKGGVVQNRSGNPLTLHNLSVSKVVSNVAAFVANNTAAEFIDPTLHTTVQVESYITLGDEGGGIFIWDPTINPLTADGGHIFASGVVTALGAWRRFTDDKILNVKHFGAVGDGVADDNTAVQLAVAAANTRLKGVLYFPEGTYNIDTPIDLTAMNMVVIRGDGVQNTIINYVGAAGPFLKLNTGAEVDELSQYAIAMDFTVRTDRVGLTGILITSSALVSDITRSALFTRLLFTGATAADGWDTAIHSQDVRGVTVSEVYARHVSGSIGTIFWNIDNTIAFADTTYTADNNETHFYATDFGIVIPAGGSGGGGGGLPGPNTVTISMLADATPGDIITYDATGGAILLPIGTTNAVLTSAGPGLPPIWQLPVVGGIATATAGDLITYDALGAPILLGIGALDQVLKSAGPGLPPIWSPLGSGSLVGVQAFTANGTYTPTIGTNSILVFCTGGGGAGGTGNGGTSSFGTLLSATGGTFQGIAGVGIGGVLNISGGRGRSFGGTPNFSPGAGGASFWGSGLAFGGAADGVVSSAFGGGAGGTSIGFITTGFGSVLVTIGSNGGFGTQSGNGVVFILEFA